jgi:hypothetical protein
MAPEVAGRARGAGGFVARPPVRHRVLCPSHFPFLFRLLPLPETETTMSWTYGSKFLTLRKM